MIGECRKISDNSCYVMVIAKLDREYELMVIYDYTRNYSIRHSLKYQVGSFLAGEAYFNQNYPITITQDEFIAMYKKAIAAQIEILENVL